MPKYIMILSIILLNGLPLRMAAGEGRKTDVEIDPRGTVVLAGDVIDGRVTTPNFLDLSIGYEYYSLIIVGDENTERWLQFDTESLNLYRLGTNIGYLHTDPRDLVQRVHKTAGNIRMCGSIIQVR